MAVVTPYEGVDYQQLSAYRPYQLPVNDIFKGVAAQSQYWDEGAYRVKSVYDTALNLSLTKDENKQIRDKFVKDSEELLAKLSTMNLADPSVQRTGVGIYKPLFQDKGIISDHAATEYISNLNGEIEQYKKKDNGKYYNAFNHQYALLGVKEFKDSKDRNAGEEYLKVAKRYEPYHDYTEEYKKVKDLCPADEQNRQFPFYGDDGKSMTGYLKKIEHRFRSIPKAYNCLLSNLSAASMRQLQIEGTVNYKMTPIEDFAKEVSNEHSTQIEQYKKRREEISAELLKIRGDAKLTKDQKKEKYLKYSEEQSQITESIISAETKRDKLENGDFTELNENFESYAGSLYTHKKLYKEAVSLAFEEYSEMFEGDPVQLSKIKFEQDKWLQSANFNHQIDMFNRGVQKEYDFKMMDQQFQLAMKRLDLFFGPQNTTNQRFFDIDPKTGQIVPKQLTETDYLKFNEFKEGDVIDGVKIYNQMREKIDNYNTQLSQNNEATFNKMITLAETDSRVKESLLTSFGAKDLSELKQKFANNPNDFINSTFFQKISSPLGGRNTIPELDKILDQYEVTNATLTSGLAAVQTEIDLQEKEVNTRLGYDPNKFIQDKLQQKLKEKGLTENVKFREFEFTPMEIIQMANEGKTVMKNGNSFSISIDDDWRPGYDSYNIKMNGKSLGYNYNDIKQSERLNKIIGTSFEMIDFYEPINKVRSDVYKTSNFSEKPRFVSINDSDHIIAQKIQSAFLDAEGKPNKLITIAGFDGSGSIAVSIPSGSNTSDVQSKIKSLGIGSGNVSQLNQEGTLFQVDGTNYGVMNQPINDPLIRNIATNITGVTKTVTFDKAKVGQLVTQLKVPVFNAGQRIDGYINIIKEGQGNARFTLTAPSFADEPLIESRSALGFMNSYTDIHQNITDEYIRELNRIIPGGFIPEAQRLPETKGWATPLSNSIPSFFNSNQ